MVHKFDKVKYGQYNGLWSNFVSSKEQSGYEMDLKNCTVNKTYTKAKRDFKFHFKACNICTQHQTNSYLIQQYDKRLQVFTEEVVKNPFAECSVDFHEVCQTVEILFTWDPLWFLCFIRLLTGIVQAEEAALLRSTQRDANTYTVNRLLTCLILKPCPPN